jgi:hypothetical protein
MWVKFTLPVNPGFTQTIAFNNSSGSSNNGFVLNLLDNGTILYIIYRNSSGQVLFQLSSSGITDSNWKNIVIVGNGSVNDIYVNNVNFGSANLESFGTGNSQISLKIGEYRSVSGGIGFNGNMAIFSIYNRTLTTTEITQNYNALKSRFGLT